MKKLLIIALLLLSGIYARKIDGLEGVYVNEYGKKVLEVAFGDNTGMMFINGRMYDCAGYILSAYFSKSYRHFYKTSWAPPHSFIYAFQSKDPYCELESATHSVLFVILEDDGWIFNNYSEIVAKTNIKVKNITNVVDNPLQFGTILTKN